MKLMQPSIAFIGSPWRVSPFIYLLPVFVCLWIAGCRNEHIEPDTPDNGNIELPGDRVAYTLYTSSPDYVRPITRTGIADEDNVAGDMWVFVFEVTPVDTFFVEAVKASDHETAGGNISKRTVILKTRTGKVTLFVLDNTPTHYFNGVTKEEITDLPSSWGLVSTTKLSEARVRLNTELLDLPQKSVPYTPGKKIPLSIELNYNKLDPTIELGTVTSPLELQRVVARLVVKKEFTSVPGNANTPPFVLKGVTVYNTPRNASLFPIHKSNVGNCTDYKYTGTALPDSTILGIAAAQNDSTVTNPIYLYPSAENVEVNRPFVLIQARYDKDDTDTYYKLAFLTPDSRVNRNTAYRLLITGCTGRGYTTLNAAIAAPPSNEISYKMEVTDLTSHDILDNGQYFLALSNSEYLFYLTGAATNLTVTTLSYKQTPNVTSEISITDLKGGSPSISRNPFGDTTNTTSQDLNMDFPATFKSCTLVVRYGNLTQRIPITRQYTMPASSIVQKQFASPDADFVFGSIEFPNGTPHWVGLSTDSIPENVGTDVLTRDDKGKFYLKLKSNQEEVRGSDTVWAQKRYASMYLARSSDKGRLKVYMQQDALNMARIDDTADPGFIPFVGAFWRADQTGERLVRISRNNIVGSTNLDGYWYTSGIYYDNNWDPDNGDGIRVDNLPSSDVGVWTPGGPVRSGNDADFDANHSVSKSRFVEGIMNSASNPNIYFRIGLDKIYRPTLSAPARYAIIVLAYTFNTANTSEVRYQRMFIRQGEDADYLMRPIDNYGNYGQTFPLWGTPNPYISLWGWASGTVWRPQAKKFLPYNLRIPDWSKDTAALSLRSADAGFIKEKLTDYPSQGGYHFRFSGVVGSAQQVSASIQSRPIGIWDADSSETCPKGYRRVTDGNRDATYNFSRATAEGSEIRQSLWSSPGFGNARNSESATNSLKGYYADGYFDRRMIQDAGSMSTKSAVAYNTSRVAYIGILFFNSNNYASLFFPAAGRRSIGLPTLDLAGSQGTYWTTTVTNGSANGDLVTNATWLSKYGNEPYCLNIGGPTGYGNMTDAPGMTSWNYMRGGSIRCVKDE